MKLIKCEIREPWTTLQIKVIISTEKMWLQKHKSVAVVKREVLYCGK